MSISAAILIPVIAVIRALAIHHLPKITFVALWGLVLFRLLIPLSVPLPINIPIADSGAAFFAAEDTQVIIPNIHVGTSASRINMDATYATAVPTLSNSAPRVSPIAIIWLAGMTICALFFLVTHLRCRREYKTALPLKNETINDWLRAQQFRRPVQVRYSDRINAPMTFGILKPVILFPKTTDWQDEERLRVVLTHEITHIRRFDIVWKWLLTAALCVHWFNPLVWVMYIFVNRDIELSCDEKVVRTFGEKMKSSYALALIGLEENRFSPLCNNFAKNAIEERITTIMKLKKASIIGIIAAVALISAFSVAVLAMSSANNSPADLSLTDGEAFQSPPAPPAEEPLEDDPGIPSEASEPDTDNDYEILDSTIGKIADSDAGHNIDNLGYSGAGAGPFGSNTTKETTWYVDSETLSEYQWWLNADADMTNCRVVITESGVSAKEMSLEEFIELYVNNNRLENLDGYFFYDGEIDILPYISLIGVRELSTGSESGSETRILYR